MLFNPWNDLALASNDPHYTPPASAIQMAEDLADLSFLWADLSDIRILPWGWSPLLVSLLREAGVADENLPTVTQMAEYRAFASRQTAVRLLRNLKEMWLDAWREGWMIGESCWCRAEQEVRSVHLAYGASMLKAPWSGSGRGVHPTTVRLSDKDVAWIRRTLHRQGGVEVEPLYYNKVLDFAMEFWAEAGRVRYEGLSLFTTTAGGVYSGNLVASEQEKQRRLAQYIPLNRLLTLRERLLKLLGRAHIPSWYTGPFGIDMMVVARTPSSIDSCSYSIHPLVEINFRMTMGWLALQLAHDLKPDEICLFRILQERGHYRWELKPYDL